MTRIELTWVLALGCACGSSASSDSDTDVDATEDGSASDDTGASGEDEDDDDDRDADDDDDDDDHDETGDETGAETGDEPTCVVGDEACTCERIDVELALGMHDVRVAHTSPPVLMWNQNSMVSAQTLVAPDALGGAPIAIEPGSSAFGLFSNAEGDLMMVLGGQRFMPVSASLQTQPAVDAFDPSRGVTLVPDGDGWVAFSAVTENQDTRRFYRSRVDASGAVIEDQELFTAPYDTFVPNALRVVKVGEGWAAAWGTYVGDASPYYDLRLGRFDADWSPVGDPVVVAGGQRSAMALVARDDAIEIVHGSLGGGQVARYDAESLAALESASVDSDVAMDVVETSRGWMFLFFDGLGTGAWSLQRVSHELEVGPAVELNYPDVMKLAVVDDEVVTLWRGQELDGLPLMASHWDCTPD